MKLFFSIALSITMIHNFKGRKKSQDIELMGFVIKINEYITKIIVTNSKFYKIILYKN